MATAQKPMDSHEQVAGCRRDPARVTVQGRQHHRHSLSSTSSLLQPLVLVAILAAQVPDHHHVNSGEAPPAASLLAWADSGHVAKPPDTLAKMASEEDRKTMLDQNNPADTEQGRNKRIDLVKADTDVSGLLPLYQMFCPVASCSLNRTSKAVVVHAMAKIPAPPVSRHWLLLSRVTSLQVQHGIGSEERFAQFAEYLSSSGAGVYLRLKRMPPQIQQVRTVLTRPMAARMTEASWYSLDMQPRGVQSPMREPSPAHNGL